MAGIFRAFFVSLCLLQSTAFRLGPASNFGTKILAHKLHSVAASSNAIGNQLAENKKLGVLLLNLGGPEKNEDVEGFLYNLFADPDIIRLPKFLSPLQGIIAFLISKIRGPKSAEAYKKIGGGSPINMYTRQQAHLIEESLHSKGYDAKCYIGMRYWHPFTEEALSELKKDNISSLVILPLYPHFSISTSGSSLKLLKKIFDSAPKLYGSSVLNYSVVPSWYFRPGYIKTMTQLILKEISTYTDKELQDQNGVDVLFSAHGVPKSYIEAGDPYQAHIQDCVHLIAKEISSQLDVEIHNRQMNLSSIPYLEKFSTEQLIWLAEHQDNRGRTCYSSMGASSSSSSSSACSQSTSSKCNPLSRIRIHLSYQSKVGPVEWLTPSTDNKIIHLSKQGVQNLVVVPISFVSEHIETLEEIDLEYHELAEEHNIHHWKRVPALNTDASFIEELSSVVIDALHQDPISLDESLDLPKQKRLVSNAAFLGNSYNNKK